MYSLATRVAPLALVLSLALGSSAQVDTEAAKVASLRLAPTTVDRIKLLQDNEFVFNFLEEGVTETKGAGGHTVEASSANFPALVGNGMAMTIGFLGPCGFNTPHTHPRATEFNFAVNGTVQSGFLVENGARFVFNEIPPGSAAIFPKGAIHFEMNNGCEDMIFVAAFNDEDPGVEQVAQRFFGLPPAFVAASLGDIGVEQVAGLEAMIPDNVALGTDECLKRCGLTRDTQATGQRQPRVSANALPSGFSGPPAPPSASTPVASTPTGAPVSSAATSAVRSTADSSFSKLASDDAVSGGVTVQQPNGKINPLIISLIVVVAVLAAGYAVLACVYFYKRKQERTSRTKGSKYFRTGADFAPQAAMFDAEKPQPFESYDAAAHEQMTPYDSPAGHS